VAQAFLPVLFTPGELPLFTWRNFAFDSVFLLAFPAACLVLYLLQYARPLHATGFSIDNTILIC
jgi:hypothetical protein